MINYEVDPAVLLPYLPPATELDFYQQKALVSVVGFMFSDTQVFGLRWPWHTTFEEVNLRFYVRHYDGTQWKRGVVFVSEIVPRPVIANMARWLYHEPYSTKAMRHSIVVEGENLHCTYCWRHQNKWNCIDINAEASLNDIKPGSEEEFIFEHYWGYNKYNAATTVEYGVEHVIWQVHTVKEWSFKCDVAALYGKSFVPFLNAAPSSVFLAKGSDVVIRKPRFIRD